jgi:hypothetical protein
VLRSDQPLVLELGSVNFLKKWQYYDKGATYYHWMVRDFLAELLEYENGTCVMPGTDEKIDYGDAWASKAESALDRARKARDFEQEKKDRKAAEDGGTSK